VTTGVAVAGVGTIAGGRRPTPALTAAVLLSAALERALRDAGVQASDIDGLGVASFGLAPDRAIDFAWHAGLRLRWLMEDVTAMNLVQHAVRAVAAGDAETIAIVGGDNLLGGSYGKLVENYNATTRDYLSVLPAGGPNALFALLTQEHMSRHGLDREHYGQVVTAQRRWAATNPYAAFRGELAMAEYLAAPVVAPPLTLFDCPPPVAGAEAIVLRASDSVDRGRRVEVRAVAASFNADAHEGDGLTTGLAGLAPRLWAESGLAAALIDVVEVYDDYPVMVLAQLEDLGFIENGDGSAILGGPGRPPPAVNTGGGLLCAGQAGAGGGLQGFVEAVRQLRHERGAGQVPDAAAAVVAGYGMVLYRYGAASVAAVLSGPHGRLGAAA
jgi:acetyl-CoA acetyltransferase